MQSAGDGLTLGDDGAQRVRAALDAGQLAKLECVLAEWPQKQAGLRLRGSEKLRAIMSPSGPIGAVAATFLGANCFPVRAILFDKNPSTDWALAWHQDRTVAVRQRREVNGFGPWTIKNGWHHVAPPADVLARLITLRVHIDAVSALNGPLLIAPGSHVLGRVPEGQISQIVDRLGTAACLADAGDVWVYSTPILHASEAAQDPTHRRVLQIDYATAELPGELKWLGV